MIEQLLPAAAVVVEAGDDLPAAALFPEEEAIVARAVEKRRQEFTTARACARQAFARLGMPPVPVVAGARGEPLWPEPLVGSITHCDGYCACALARRDDLATIGIDAEPNEPLPAGLLGDVARPEERPRLASLALTEPAIHWDRLLFSAKEAVYKAWFPLAERWLGFEDAILAIDPAHGTFSARLLVPGPTFGERPLTGFAGRWAVRDGLVLTAIAATADDLRHGGHPRRRPTTPTTTTEDS
jgi:4'-phosphopantetheinyl transferase EntD